MFVTTRCEMRYDALWCFWPREGTFSTIRGGAFIARCQQKSLQNVDSKCYRNCRIWYILQVEGRAIQRCETQLVKSTEGASDVILLTITKPRKKGKSDNQYRYWVDKSQKWRKFARFLIKIYCCPVKLLWFDKFRGCVKMLAHLFL